MSQDKVVIIGTGPSGMACAYTLVNANQPTTIIEKDGTVGGLCRTINFHGYLFDIGGHRFLSKSKEINHLWHEIMGDDMISVRRLSRIYYRKRYFKYPLSFINTFWNLGPIESLLCVISYLEYKVFKKEDDSTFEGWITNRFGKRLYEIFFKTYTEKVWAVPCEKISADWAVQRIRGLSLKVAIQKALFGKKRRGPKTLSEEFLYPRTGPGEFYNRLKDKISESGSEFLFHRDVVGIKHEGKKIVSIENDGHRREKKEMAVNYLFSSIPLTTLIKILKPSPPADVVSAAEQLHFRSFVVVNVILDKKDIFSDQWIYVHSPEVRLGRIQNYKNWSPAMVADPNKTSLGLEYFCTVGDALWEMNDIDLIDYAMKELEKIGIASRKHLIHGFVVRQADVYPIYHLGYKVHVDIIRRYLSQFSNFQTIGRQGLFRYDNSDHALLTGIYAAKNFLSEGSSNLWSLDADEGYLES